MKREDRKMGVASNNDVRMWKAVCRRRKVFIRVINDEQFGMQVGRATTKQRGCPERSPIMI